LVMDVLSVATGLWAAPQATARSEPRSIDHDGSLRSPLAGVRSSRLLEMVPKKTPRQFQSIEHWGACRKTPVTAENHHLEVKKVAGGVVAKFGICCRPTVFPGASSR
jgi:hypothetical protein